MVIWHWFTMVAAAERTVEPGTEGFGKDIQWMAKYFYAENGLLVSTQATRLHQAFDVLPEMFDCIRLLTNVVNTVSMAYKPCCTIGGHSAEAYGIRLTGEGLSYRERLCQRFRCPECNADLAAGSLDTHRQIQHRVGQGDLRATPPPHTCM